MKTLTALILVLNISQIYSQTNIVNVCSNCAHNNMTFDFNYVDDSTTFFFEMDTTQLDNLWQLGTVSKTFFDYGLSGPRAFLTDTINTYPINNISSFEFTLTNCSALTLAPCGGYFGTWTYIYHKINSDTLLDGGTIEVSHSGSPWINLISDPLAIIIGEIYTIEDTVASLNKPGFSGTSDGWKTFEFGYDLSTIEPNDTIRFRFTFSSDAFDTNKDGWMLGIVDMTAFYEGLLENSSSDLISVFPNPASDELTIIPLNENQSKLTISIYNSKGEEIYFDANFQGEKISISFLEEGVYFLKYSEGNKYAVERFVKIK